MMLRERGTIGSAATLSPSRALRRSRAVVFALVLVLAAIGVAACGSSSSSSSTSASGAGSSSSSSSAASSSPTGGASAGVARAAAVVAARRGVTSSYPPPGPAINVKPLKGKSIWYIPLGASIPVVQIEAQGVQEAVKAAGMSYSTCDGKLQPAQWAACINQAVNAGAAGIITDSIDPSSVATAVASAKSHNIPLLLGNETDAHSPLLQGMSIGGDFEDQPPMMDWIIADSGGKAHILTSTVQGDKATQAEVTNSLAELHKNCPSCVQYNINSTPETLNTIGSSTSSALIQHSDVTYGYPEFDFFEPLFARGAQTSGHQIKVVSTNDALTSLQEIKAGSGQVADSGANRNYLGWSATDRILRMILHKPEPTSVTVPVRVFDKTNIGSISLTQAASVSGEWWGTTAYKQQFPKLWGVG